MVTNECACAEEIGMPTRWDPNWSEERKSAYKKARREKYAAGRQAEGKNYTPRASEQVGKCEVASNTLDTLKKVTDGN